MAWSKLFKAKPKPDPRIRWFGKLPTYPDYYSSPADEEWVVEFNDWVLKGVEAYQNRLKGAGIAARRLPVAGCVIRLPKSGMTVFSSILDFGGDMRGRPFPLCFYAAIPSAQWPGPTSDRLTSAARAVRKLLDLRHDVVRFLNSPGRFETTFGDREIDLADVDGQSQDRSWLASAKQVSLSEWFDRAKAGLKIQNESTWKRMTRQWGEHLTKHEGRDFEPTLRFPLAMRLPVELQIAGWMCWLESRMDIRRRFLSLVVTGELDHETGHLSVIAREVVREDFLLLTSTATTLPYLDDLSTLQVNPQDESPASLPVESVTANSAETWGDFVEAERR